MSDLREKYAEAISAVTDLWDEPLDEVHDVPQIVNAVLAVRDAEVERWRDALAKVEMLASSWEHWDDYALANFGEKNDGRAYASALRRILASVPAVDAGDREPASEDRRPHSRACGIGQHEHGRDCHTNCPTCGGMVARKPASEVQP